MIKILVTGAGGQLGSSIKFVAEKRSDFLFDYTDLNELDICNLNSLKNYLSKTAPDYIVNCAAYTAVDKAESEQELCFQLNAEAVKNLREAASLINSKIIHISTDYVFNGRNNKPYLEEDIPDPGSIYGQSKLKGEIYLKGDPNSIIIRTSWLYSQFGGNFLKTMVRYGRERDELRVVYDQTGTPTYAPDLAKAIIAIISYSESYGKTFLPGIYHYSNEGITNWFDFAWEIIESLKINCRVTPIETKDFPTAAPRPVYSVLNKDKIRKAFGLEIPHWKVSLRECLEHIK
jgi:dTDP-4-dehydrorhamnose reductase